MSNEQDNIHKTPVSAGRKQPFGDADKKLDWTQLGIRFVYRKGIAITLYGFGNCNTVIPNMLNSLQIRRHHLASPFPS